VVLLESTNPYGNIVCVVEDDGETIYLYLHHVEDRRFGLRPLWLANRIEAPQGGDIAARRGRAPLLESAHLDETKGDALGASDPSAWDASGLEVVWLPEGDGVALVRAGALVALVPSGAGEGRAPGYVRGVRGRAKVAFGFDEYAGGEAALEALVSDARAYWAQRASASHWETTRTDVLAAFESRLGPHVGYWAADSGKFPPLGVARFVLGDAVSVYTTVGMSAQPLPASDGARRIEIALATVGEPAWAPNVVAWLGKQPWTAYVPFAHGDAIACPTATASWFVPDHSAMLLLERIPDALDAASTLPKREAFSGAPFDVLWALPLTLFDLRAFDRAGLASLVRGLAARGRTAVFEG
jgi:hypothetical protein